MRGFNTASGMYALQLWCCRCCVRTWRSVSIPQAVCTRCNLYAPTGKTIKEDKFQYRKRYVRVATRMVLLNVYRRKSVSIPQAVCTRCNWRKTTITFTRFQWFQYRKRYVRVATNHFAWHFVVRKKFQYRKRYVRVATVGSS